MTTLTKIGSFHFAKLLNCQLLKTYCMNARRWVAVPPQLGGKYITMKRFSNDLKNKVHVINEDQKHRTVSAPYPRVANCKINAVKCKINAVKLMNGVYNAVIGTKRLIPHTTIIDAGQWI